MIALLQYCDDENISPGGFDKTTFENNNTSLKDCSFSFSPIKPKKRVKEFHKIFPSKTERVSFLNSIKNDINFIEHIDNASFSFSAYIHKLDNENEINKHFNRYYSDFFDYEVGGGNNRHHFKEEYKRVNPINFHMCPACLGEMNLNNAQLDHYFPKSTFPSLVIHPYNLVPLCISCNTAIGGGKGNRPPTNPLKPEDANEAGSLGKVFIPYKIAGIKTINLTFEGKNGKRVKTVAKDIQNKQHVQNHTDTFNLESVWTERLVNTHKNIVHQIVEHFISLEKPTREEVGDYIWKNMLSHSDIKINIMDNYFLRASYLKFLGSNIVQFNTLYCEVLLQLKEYGFGYAIT